MKIKELDELKQLTDSLASVGLKSSLLIEKPMWLKMIDHQIKAVNIVNYTSMSSALSKMACLLPKHDLTGCIRGLDTYKYVLDTSNLANLNGIQRVLTDVSTTLSSVIPYSYSTLNLLGMYSLECEVARSFSSAKIHTNLAMSSLKIADALSPLISLNSTLLSRIDLTISKSFLTSYASLITNQYKYVQKDVFNSEKHLKIIEIATDIVSSHIETIASKSSSDSEENIQELNDECLQKNRTAIQYIPTYLGYTLKNGSEYDLDEEFAKSMVGKIVKGGKNIAQKIEDINEICLAQGKKCIFSLTNKMISNINCISISFSADKTTFGSVIDSLYMLLYEGSGDAARMVEILGQDSCSTLWKIKDLRTSFRHDTEHGKEKKYLSKKKEIGEAYSSICGKVLPVKQKDWVSAHYNLFVEVEKLLDNIIEKIS